MKGSINMVSKLAVMADIKPDPNYGLCTLTVDLSNYNATILTRYPIAMLTITPKCAEGAVKIESSKSLVPVQPVTFTSVTGRFEFWALDGMSKSMFPNLWKWNARVYINGRLITTFEFSPDCYKDEPVNLADYAYRPTDGTSTPGPGGSTPDTGTPPTTPPVQSQDMTTVTLTNAETIDTKAGEVFSLTYTEETTVSVNPPGRTSFIVMVNGYSNVMWDFITIHGDADPYAPVWGTFVWDSMGWHLFVDSMIWQDSGGSGVSFAATSNAEAQNPSTVGDGVYRVEDNSAPEQSLQSTPMIAYHNKLDKMVMWSPVSLSWRNVDGTEL